MHQLQIDSLIALLHPMNIHYGADVQKQVSDWTGLLYVCIYGEGRLYLNINGVYIRKSALKLQTVAGN